VITPVSQSTVTAAAGTVSGLVSSASRR
jgi:hypothetical protein